MDITKLIIGLSVSAIGGWIVLWFVIEKLAWPYVIGNNPQLGFKSNKKPPSLTIPLGIVERVLYTIAVIIGAYEWIAVWLAMKTAVQWDRWTGNLRVTYNVFLLGNALSILFGLFGAWIALGFTLPKFTTNP
jgi:hypothetical protein